MSELPKITEDEWQSIVIPELEKVAKAGMRNNPWTEHEERVLRSYRGRVSLRVIAEYLGRSLDSVQHKSKSMR